MPRPAGAPGPAAPGETRRPRDRRRLHGEIKASTPGLILTIPLINTDVGVAGGGGGVGMGVGGAVFLSFNLSSSFHFVFFLLRPPSPRLSPSVLSFLNQFGSDGEAL